MPDSRRTIGQTGSESADSKRSVRRTGSETVRQTDRQSDRQDVNQSDTFTVGLANRQVDSSVYIVVEDSVMKDKQTTMSLKIDRQSNGQSETVWSGIRQ